MGRLSIFGLRCPCAYYSFCSSYFEQRNRRFIFIFVFEFFWDYGRWAWNNFIRWTIVNKKFSSKIEIKWWLDWREYAWPISFNEKNFKKNLKLKSKWWIQEGYANWIKLIIFTLLYLQQKLKYRIKNKQNIWKILWIEQKVFLLAYAIHLLLEFLLIQVSVKKPTI